MHDKFVVHREKAGKRIKWSLGQKISTGKMFKICSSFAKRDIYKKKKFLEEVGGFEGPIPEFILRK